MAAPLRVIQWATGNVGSEALRAILARPDLALAGVLVTDPAEDGRDAGELCGVAPTGVRAMRDREAPPGLRTSFDLPLVRGSRALATEQRGLP